MVGRGGHAFSHQHRIRAGTGVILKLNRTEHTGFRHANHIVRQIRGQFVVLVHIHLEVFKIAGVDANDLGPGIDGPLNILTGVCFHQHRHIEAMREIEQRLELDVVQCGDDEQHQIGTMRTSASQI